MASPQKENGYTPIANEIMYALSKTSMPIKCRQVLDVIMQMTWGWSRKDAEISTDYFIEKTGMLRQRFQEAKSTLVSMNIITVSKHVYAIQKDHEKWNCPEIRSVKKERNPGQKRTESRTEKERNPGHATIGKTILKQKTSGVSTKDGITDEQYRKNFELLWSALPTDKKIRKQVAYKAYRRTVTSPLNHNKCSAALQYHIEKNQRDAFRFVFGGSRFFQEWQDIYEQYLESGGEPISMAGTAVDAGVSTGEPRTEERDRSFQGAISGTSKEWGVTGISDVHGNNRDVSECALNPQGAI